VFVGVWRGDGYPPSFFVRFSFPPNNEAFFFVFCLPRPADDIIKRNLYLGRLTKLSNANLGEKNADERRTFEAFIIIFFDGAWCSRGDPLRENQTPF
jgi:hypothetical protein